MRKEIIFVILASVVFGAIIAFGVWRANTALIGNENHENISNSKDTASQEPNNELGLTIDKPSQDDVITQSPVKLSGISTPGSWIVISSVEDDYIVQIDESGLFESKVELSGGINQLSVSAFDSNGNSINKTVRLIYSSEFAKVLSDTETN